MYLVLNLVFRAFSLQTYLFAYITLLRTLSVMWSLRGPRALMLLAGLTN